MCKCIEQRSLRGLFHLSLKYPQFIGVGWLTRTAAAQILCWSQVRPHQLRCYGESTDYRRSRDGQHYSKCLYSRLPENSLELKNGCIASSLGWWFLRLGVVLPFFHWSTTILHNVRPSVGIWTVWLLHRQLNGRDILELEVVYVVMKGCSIADTMLMLMVLNSCHRWVWKQVIYASVSLVMLTQVTTGWQSGYVWWM